MQDLKHFDRFERYVDLADVYAHDQDYRITSQFGSSRRILVAAIHGGNIEPGTSDIARAIAGDDHGLYLFEGLEWSGGYHDMHITSDNFDEPICDAMAAAHDIVMSVHGCRDDWGDGVMIGGLDHTLCADITDVLQSAGITVQTEDHVFSGASPRNICNRGRLGRGIQIEIPRRMRNSIDHMNMISRAVMLVV